MSALGRLIRDHVAAQGPVTIAQYMALCLLHPQYGYYATRDPLGAAGDFTTAPEISQMFGELIGAWAAQVWAEQGHPNRFVLAELGPGRGTLMQDALRAVAAADGCHAAAEVWLVESSPVLRRIQAATLAGLDIRWTDRADALPQAPLIVLANEFFDALPVRQYRRVDALWRERLVGLADAGLSFTWTDPRPDAALDTLFGSVPDGTIVEHAEVAEAVTADLAARIEAHGGAMLVLDYGAWEGTGDTLQALRHHMPVHPLAEPGLADLTAHVRFRALADAARPLAHSGPVGQGAFLERLGITARAQALARGRCCTALEAVVAAHRRLTHPEEMGTLFQVLAVSPPGAPPLPGFAS